MLSLTPSFTKGSWGDEMEAEPGGQVTAAVGLSVHLWTGAQGSCGHRTLHWAQEGSVVTLNRCSKPKLGLWIWYVCVCVCVCVVVVVVMVSDTWISSMCLVLDTHYFIFFPATLWHKHYKLHLMNMETGLASLTNSYKVTQLVNGGARIQSSSFFIHTIKSSIWQDSCHQAYHHGGR